MELLDGAEPIGELAAVVVAAAVDELVNRVEVEGLDRAGIRRGGRGVGVAAVVLALGGPIAGGAIPSRAISVGSIIRTIAAVAVAGWLAAAVVGAAGGAAISAGLIIRTFLLRLALPGVAIAGCTLTTGGLIAAGLIIRTLGAVPSAIGPLYR